MDDMKRPGRDWTHGEDHEGKMAMSQLHRLNDITSMLLDMLSSEDELPGWVQSKLTRAYTDLNDVFGYLEPQADLEAASSVPTVSEAKGLWDRIRDRRKAKKRRLRPGEK
jgi:hypothetical protein